MTGGCFVMYRCFDAAGRLIYVGSTSSWMRRMSEHRRTAWWWELTARTATEVHPTLESARAAESIAIQEEQPAFNWRDAGRPWLRRRDHWTDADHEAHRHWHESRGLRPTALETFNRAAWRRPAIASDNPSPFRLEGGTDAQTDSPHRPGRSAGLR